MHKYIWLTVVKISLNIMNDINKVVLLCYLNLR